MNAFLSKLAMLGVVLGGFFVTGDLPRLIDRGRRIAERSTVPLPSSDAVTTNPMPLPPAPPPPLASPLPRAPLPSAPLPTVPLPATQPPAAPLPVAPVASDDAGPSEDEASTAPSRIPMPSLTLESIDFAALSPGQRVLVRSGRHLIAFDVVDGPAGEVLEHGHAVHADGSVTIASTAAARRLVVIGGSPYATAGSNRPPARTGGRIALGDWIHVVPSGSAASRARTSASRITTAERPGHTAAEQLGPIEAIGIE